MNAHLQLPESTSIPEDLRRRMEGRVELLEDAVHLFQATVSALNRQAVGDDDVRTMREVVLQLQRIDAARTRLSTEAPAQALVARLDRELSHVSDAVVAFLQHPPSSLKTGLTEVIGRLSARPRPPGPGETVLLTGQEGLASAVPWVAGAAAAATAIIAGPFAVLSPLVFGVTVWAARRLAPARGWALLPDRLYFHQDDEAQLELRELRSAQLHAGGVTLNERITLTRHAAALHRWLTLLRAPVLSGLEARPRPHARCGATMEANRQRGQALVLREGVLFVPRETFEELGRTLAPLPIAPSGDDVLTLVAHLPEGRVGAFAELVGAQWWPRTSLTLTSTRLDSFRVSDAEGRQLRFDLQLQAHELYAHVLALLER